MSKLIKVPNQVYEELTEIKNSGEKETYGDVIQRLLNLLAILNRVIKESGGL